MTPTFSMPSLGADMAAGVLADWHRKPGDAVHRGDIIASVETDKGVIDVEVFADGTVGELLVEPGQEVPVGTPLATILDGTAGRRPPPAPAAPRPRAGRRARAVSRRRRVSRRCRAARHCARRSAARRPRSRLGCGCTGTGAARPRLAPRRRDALAPALVAAPAGGRRARRHGARELAAARRRPRDDHGDGARPAASSRRTSRPPPAARRAARRRAGPDATGDRRGDEPGEPRDPALPRRPHDRPRPRRRVARAGQCRTAAAPTAADGGGARVRRPRWRCASTPT